MQTEVHEFNPFIAANFGVPAALEYQYIKRLNYGQRIDGYRQAELDDEETAPPEARQITLGTLAKRYPYLGLQQIRQGLWNLHSEDYAGTDLPPLLKRAKSRNGIIRYCVLEYEDWPIIGNKPWEHSKGLHRFQTGIASKLGVPAAAIFENFRHWISTNWQNAIEEWFDQAYSMDPLSIPGGDKFAATKPKAIHYANLTEWRLRSGYVSRTTMWRSLQLLERNNYLVSLGKVGDTNLYTLGRAHLTTLQDELSGQFSGQKRGQKQNCKQNLAQEE
jgi:hypothetical protein